MNRITLNLLKQSTTIPLPQLKQLTQCTPYSQGWLSQKFPIYPIVINFHIANPPFNRISISMRDPYLPERIVVEGSADCKEFFRIREVGMEGDVSNIVLNLQQNHYYKYLRLKIHPPTNSPTTTTNICKQVYIRCIEVTYITFYGCEYVCSMKKALELDPCLFRILEMLEYRALLAKDMAKGKGLGQGNAEEYRYLSKKYYADIQGILGKMKEWKQNPKKLSQQCRQNLLQQLQSLSNQPLTSLSTQSLLPPKQTILNELTLLQSQLQNFYITRLKNLHKDVTDYFDKYWNKQIKEEYLRLLSSPDHQDHGKALTGFWEEVKKLGEIGQGDIGENVQEAVVMFFNYFLEYVHDPLKIVAVKILCLLARNFKLGFNIYFVYQRLMFNLFCQLNTQQKPQLLQTSLKCIYTYFQKIPDNLFLQSLLNPQHSQKLRTKLLKLDILQKVTRKSITIDARDRDMIIQYLLEILGEKDITLEEKNLVYNVVAYLAGLYGRDAVIGRFGKLNAMLLMNLQKIVDKKLALIKLPKKQQDLPICQYCGTSKQSFKDPNIYDLHCFKDCRYLTPCRYCSQVVQIPELNKHYISACQQRNLFKECQECNQVIVKLKEEEHRKGCLRVFGTKCGLCGEKMEGKLKLKQHILKDGCPNNPR